MTGVQPMPNNTGRLSGCVEKLLVEMALSVLIVLAHLNCDTAKYLMGSISSRPAGVLAAAYTAATLVSVRLIFFNVVLSFPAVLH